MRYLVPKQSLGEFAAIPRRASPEEVASVLAIQCVIQGRCLNDYAVLSQDVDRSTLKMFRIGARIYEMAKMLMKAETKLTKRELQVLELLITGISNKEIAGHINLSERTVKFHVSSLLTKYRVRGRVELIQQVGMRIKPFVVKRLAEAS
jgi:DNA-binding NarL/FixJ family response regulator